MLYSYARAVLARDSPLRARDIVNDYRSYLPLRRSCIYNTNLKVTRMLALEKWKVNEGAQR